MHRRSICWLVLAALLSASMTLLGAQAQAPADPVPSWAWRVTPQEWERLHDAGRTYEGGLFLLVLNGAPAGTGFCISTKHRLLVTAGHNFQKGLRAVNASTGRSYAVQTGWVHEKFLRQNAKGQWVPHLAAPTGTAHTRSADIAILQLAFRGPAIPRAFPLVRPDHGELFPGRAIAVLGFPGLWQLLRLNPGDMPRRAVSCGVIAQTFPLFQMDTTTAAPSWVLQHAAPTWPGHSGSPIILEDGSVVGVTNAAQSLMHGRGPTDSHMAFYGIAVDAIWDLLSTAQGIQDVLDPTRDGVRSEVHRKDALTREDRMDQKRWDAKKVLEGLAEDLRKDVEQGKTAEALVKEGNNCDDRSAIVIRAGEHGRKTGRRKRREKALKRLQRGL